MKKVFSFLVASALTLGVMTTFDAVAATYSITPKAPKVSQSLKPIIVKYRNKNYVGAMQDLEELVKVEKSNIYAKYYLALCYTRLGYKEEAKILYNEIVNKDENIALSYYSQKALDCIENPESPVCKPQAEREQEGDEERNRNMDDMALFIQSGQMIHPSAMDKITNERMQRKIEKDLYERQQMELNNQQMLKSDASKPTNDEIVAAINTLQKIGINPYSANQFNPLAQAQQYKQLGLINNPYMMGLNQNTDLASMYLYSQMAQQNNNIMNYGI